MSEHIFVNKTDEIDEISDLNESRFDFLEIIKNIYMESSKDKKYYILKINAN